jgi:hypothetical protein
MPEDRVRAVTGIRARRPEAIAEAAAARRAPGSPLTGDDVTAARDTAVSLLPRAVTA